MFLVVPPKDGGFAHQQFSTENLFANSLILATISKISKLVSSSLLLVKELLALDNGYKWW